MTSKQPLMNKQTQAQQQHKKKSLKILMFMGNLIWHKLSDFNFKLRTFQQDIVRPKNREIQQQNCKIKTDFHYGQVKMLFTQYILTLQQFMLFMCLSA